MFHHIPLLTSENSGLVAFVGGFLIWNLDNIFCSEVRRLRRAIGLPWAVLLEGHGWWHLLTGIGTSITMAILDFRDASIVANSARDRR